MIGKNRAYSLLAMLVLFNASIPVAVAWGFSGALAQSGSVGILELYTEGLADAGFITTTGGIAGALIVLSKFGGIRIPFSTIVFASIFTLSSGPLHNILNNMINKGWISIFVFDLIVMVYAIAFIIGIVELSR